MINKLLEELISKMWDIKDSKSFIKTSDLLNFSKEYYNAFNLVLDLLNCDVIRNKENNIDITQYEKTIIDFFKKVNKNQYNRLIIDTLMELDSEESTNYIIDIISIEKNLESFKDDFNHFPGYKNILKRLNVVKGNK